MSPWSHTGNGWRVTRKSELRRLNLEILSCQIVDFVTPITALCSDLSGALASRTRYVLQSVGLYNAFRYLMGVIVKP